MSQRNLDSEVLDSIITSLEKIRESVPGLIPFYGEEYHIDDFISELRNQTEVGIKIYEMYVRHREIARNFKP